MLKRTKITRESLLQDPELPVRNDDVFREDDVRRAQAREPKIEAAFAKLRLGSMPQMNSRNPLVLSLAVFSELALTNLA